MVQYSDVPMTSRNVVTELKLQVNRYAVGNDSAGCCKHIHRLRNIKHRFAVVAVSGEISYITISYMMRLNKGNLRRNYHNSFLILHLRL
jgi:hypothetical protein